jgi:hypothetical protein
VPASHGGWHEAAAQSEATVAIDDASLQVNLGSVRDTIGEMRFAFVVQSDGTAHVEIYCHDPTDSRKSGVFFQLKATGYAELKQLIAKTDATIAKLESAGQVKPGTMIYRPR